MELALHQELRSRYASTWGVATNHLPSTVEGVLEWQERILAAATASESENEGDAPAVAALRKLLADNQTLANEVAQMVEQQFEIVGHGTPPVATVDAMLSAMNFIVRNAPEFNEDEAKRNFFPMSSLFVFMMDTPMGLKLFQAGPFNDAIRAVLDEWCSFLDSPASRSVLNTESTGWLSAAAWELMKLDEFIIPDPGGEYGGFADFNAFFHREIKRECRPVAGRDVGMTVVSANDGTVFNIARNVQKDADIWAKDQPYALERMLDGIDGPGYSVDDFVGGDVFQSFLSGANYHRFWAPVAGTIVEQRVVDGLMFSELPVLGFDKSSGTRSMGYQASVNTRGLIYIRADWGPLKTIVVMPIGITEVSSLNFSGAVGDHVDKGQELGNFSYGGSTLALVFQPNTIMAFTPDFPPADPKTPVLLNVGSQVATAEPWRETAV